MSEAEREREDEHQVTPLELFFDLVFVFAITQVTSLLSHDPTWREFSVGCPSSGRSGRRGTDTRG